MKILGHNLVRLHENREFLNNAWLYFNKSYYKNTVKTYNCTICDLELYYNTLNQNMTIDGIIEVTITCDEQIIKSLLE